jgi:hypothetical protein
MPDPLLPLLAKPSNLRRLSIREEDDGRRDVEVEEADLMLLVSSHDDAGDWKNQGMMLMLVDLPASSARRR